MIKTYEVHELAGLVPMAMEAEQTALTLDIKENGLREPIVLWQGKIVDGRCRQKACVIANERIQVKELDDDLPEGDVRVLVKSLNTRRNLTLTQKIMSAVKQLLNKEAKSSKVLATQWGISKAILDNAKYIAITKPEFIEPLFNGSTVLIVNGRGEEVSSNKVSAVYAYVKRIKEMGVSEDTNYGFTEDSFIKTQKGKDWYYTQLSIVKEVGNIKVNQLVAELANYKFQPEQVII